ncbi:type II secretion system major pseudopilin GspG [Candidatus Dependentiae bacterium]|nr:type II secretion system major pseudopilin GspG [Candidatus Dependentiae bacterium]
MTYVKKKNYTAKGFSLIEIMVAILIVGIIGAVVATRFFGKTKDAKISAAKIELRNLQSAITLYELKMNRYPDRLEDLIEKPRDEKLAKKWTTPFLETDEIPEDPFGGEYIYKRTKGGKHPYELYSEGPEDSPGDISVWDLK